MLDFDHLRTFYYSVKEGSVAKAAELFGRNKSTLFKHLAALEKSVGSKLFTKSRKQIELTEKGEYLFSILHQNLPNIENVAKEIVTDFVVPDQLRIVTTTDMVGVWIVGAVKKLQADFPHLKVSILTAHHDFDLERAKADVAILPRQSADHLLHRKLRTLHIKLYASRAYLQKNGVPQDMADLKDHGVMVYSSDVQGPISNVDWYVGEGTKNGQTRDVGLSSNSGLLLYEAARQGMGIFPMAEEFDAFADGQDLVQVLPDWPGVPVDIFYIMDRKTLLTDIHRRFMDILQEDTKGRS